MSQPDFAELVGRAVAGDPEAMDLLLRDFEPDVRIAVRRQLPKSLRTQFDSMDFVQDLWASFFVDDGLDLGRFETRQHMLAYLTGAARNKVYEEYRRRTKTRKYDIGREEPLYVVAGDREQPRDVPAGDPTPSQHLQGEDALARLTSGRPPREAEAIRLRCEGLTFQEIAERLGMNERTVRRILEATRERVVERREWQ